MKRFISFLIVSLIIIVNLCGCSEFENQKVSSDDNHVITDGKNTDVIWDSSDDIEENNNHDAEIYKPGEVCFPFEFNKEVLFKNDDMTITLKDVYSKGISGIKIVLAAENNTGKVIDLDLDYVEVDNNYVDISSGQDSITFSEENYSEAEIVINRISLENSIIAGPVGQIELGFSKLKSGSYEFGVFDKEKIYLTLKSKAPENEYSHQVIFGDLLYDEGGIKIYGGYDRSTFYFPKLLFNVENNSGKNIEVKIYDMVINNARLMEHPSNGEDFGVIADGTNVNHERVFFDIYDGFDNHTTEIDEIYFKFIISEFDDVYDKYNPSDVLYESDYIVFDGDMKSDGENSSGESSAKPKRKAIVLGEFTYKPYPEATYELNCKGDAEGIIITGFTGEDQGKLVIPETIKDYNVVSIGYNAFNNSNFTGDLVIPNGVTQIGIDAFSGCDFTGKLVIPDSVIEIGNAAFTGCDFTGELVIPNSVTKIGFDAFGSCDGFTGDLIIPDSVTEIGSNAFRNCKGFTGDLVIGDGVITIGEKAFYECDQLSGNLVMGKNVYCIDDMAFTYCRKIKGDIIIPDTTVLIGEGAFACCEGLTSVEFGSGLNNIGSGAFQHCRGMDKAVFKNSYTQISMGLGGFYAVDIAAFDDSFPTIYGYDGSTAQAYAEEHGKKFVRI